MSNEASASEAQPAAVVVKQLPADEFVPGKDVTKARDDLPFTPLTEPLAEAWPRYGRTDVGFESLVEYDSCIRPEAYRLNSLLRSGPRAINYICDEYDQHSGEEGVYYIPASLKSDRVFLISAHHALYVELAYRYLTGSLPDPPLRYYKSAWRVPSVLVNHEARHSHQDLRQACRVFRLFMCVFEYHLYVTGHGGHSRFQDSCVLRIEDRHRFPEIPQRLLDAWPCDALFPSIPLMALYYGQSHEDMGDLAIERYNKALDEEFAVLTAIAIYDEAVSNNKVWQISHETYTLVESVLQTEGLPPLTREGREPLSWDDVLEKVKVCRGLRPEQVSPFRVGPVICMWARWNEGTGQVTKPASKPGRRIMQRYGGNYTEPAGSSYGGRAWSSAVRQEAVPSKANNETTNVATSEVVVDRRPLTPRPSTPEVVDPLATVLKGSDLASLSGFEEFYKDAKLDSQPTYTVRELLPYLQIRFNAEWNEVNSRQKRIDELEKEVKHATDNWRNCHEAANKFEDENVGLKGQVATYKASTDGFQKRIAEGDARLKEMSASRDLARERIRHLEADCRQYKDLLQSSMQLVAAYRTQATPTVGSELTTPMQTSAGGVTATVHPKPAGSVAASHASPTVIATPQSAKKSKATPTERDAPAGHIAIKAPVTRARAKKAPRGVKSKPIPKSDGGSSSDLEFVGEVTPVKKTKPKLRSVAVKPEPKSVSVAGKRPAAVKKEKPVELKIPKKVVQSSKDKSSDEGKQSGPAASPEKPATEKSTPDKIESPVSLPTVRGHPDDIPSSPPRRQRRRRC